MASFLLAGGEKGSRMALPHSRVMIHQPMGGAQGQAEDIKVEAAQIMRIKENLVRMYAQMTGQTRERIIQELDRDNCSPPPVGVDCLPTSRGLSLASATPSRAMPSRRCTV